LFCHFLLLDVPTKTQSTTIATPVEPKPDHIKVAATATIEKPPTTNKTEEKNPKPGMLTQICIRPFTFQTRLDSIDEDS